MRTWIDEKGEVLGWVLALVPLAVIAGATLHAAWRGDPVDLWPMVLLAAVGVALLARDRLRGVKIGRDGLDFGDEEPDDERD